MSTIGQKLYFDELPIEPLDVPIALARSLFTQNPYKVYLQHICSTVNFWCPLCLQNTDDEYTN